MIGVIKSFVVKILAVIGLIALLGGYLFLKTPSFDNLVLNIITQRQSR